MPAPSTTCLLFSAALGHSLEETPRHQWRPLWGRNPAPFPLAPSPPRPAPHSQALLPYEPPSYLLVRPQDLGHPVGHHGLIPRHREVAPKAVAWAEACLGGFGNIRPDHLLDLTEEGKRRSKGGWSHTPENLSLRDRALESTSAILLPQYTLTAQLREQVPPSRYSQGWPAPSLPTTYTSAGRGAVMEHMGQSGDLAPS